jgi:hypothetical protein
MREFQCLLIEQALARAIGLGGDHHWRCRVVEHHPIGVGDQCAVQATQQQAVLDRNFACQATDAAGQAPQAAAGLEMVLEVIGCDLAVRRANHRQGIGFAPSCGRCSFGDATDAQAQQREHGL